MTDLSERAAQANQVEFLREIFESTGRLGRDDIRWLLNAALPTTHEQAIRGAALAEAAQVIRRKTLARGSNSEYVNPYEIAKEIESLPGGDWQERHDAEQRKKWSAEVENQVRLDEFKDTVILFRSPEFTREIQDAYIKNRIAALAESQPAPAKEGEK